MLKTKIVNKNKKMDKEIRFKKIELSYEEKKALDKPKVRSYTPYRIKDLIPGRTYSYCTCGLSAKDVKMTKKIPTKI